MTPPGDQGFDAELVRRIEVLLGSLTGVVAARVTYDQENGAHIHVMATSEVPVAEVTRTVTSALIWGLGFELPSNQITVVQSSLPRDQLNEFLGAETEDPLPTPIAPEHPPAAAAPEIPPPPVAPAIPPAPVAMESPPAPFAPAEIPPPPVAPAIPPAPVAMESLPAPFAPAEIPATPVAPESPPAGVAAEIPPAPVAPESPPVPVAPEGPPAPPDDLQASIPATSLLEFSLGGSNGDGLGRSEFDLPRLKVQNLQVVKRPAGGFGIVVRLGDDERSVVAQREGTGTEEERLGVSASTALDAVQEFLQAESKYGPGVALRFRGARRLHRPEHDVVVVLVEAAIGDRRIPLSGAAYADGGVERASILATLQATNSFVAGTLMIDTANGVSVQ